MKTRFLDRTTYNASEFGEVLISPEDGEIASISELKRRIKGFSVLTGCKTVDVRMSATFVRAIDGRTSDYESRTRIEIGRELIVVFPVYSKPYKTKPELVERMRLHLRVQSP
jgi:hypothetical protein